MSTVETMDSHKDDNLSRQRDEVEALSAIYGDDFITMDEENRIYEVWITNDINPEWSASLQFLLPPGYPGNDQPALELLQCSLLRADDQILLIEALQGFQQIAHENVGENYLFQWIEKLREILEKRSREEQEILEAQELAGLLNDGDDFVDNLSKVMEEVVIQDNPPLNDPAHECENDSQFEIMHGEPFTDRKSTFQAHLAVVTSRDQVDEILHELKRNRKVANASHNITAYRIFNAEKNVCIQDCDDDGENAAGSRLLHLLQIIDAKNVVIVVTRWYGGLLLGPDRFKHINNCARNLLQSCGYVDTKSSPSNRDSKSKSRLKLSKKYK